MKKWWNKNKIYAAGALAGAAGGYLYYRFVGCSTGTCRITSNPWNSMAYFALMGILLSGMFKKDKTENGNRKENIRRGDTK